MFPALTVTLSFHPHTLTKIPQLPGAALHRYGHMRVRALLNRERFPRGFANSPLAAQFSSLGSLDAKWLPAGAAGQPGGGRRGRRRAAGPLVRPPPESS